MRQHTSQRLFLAQQEILGLIAAGCDLPIVLSRLGRAIEDEEPGLRCTILTGAVLPENLTPCWIQPIFTGGGERLGTVLIHGCDSSEPGALVHHLVSATLPLARIALERQQSAERLAFLADHDPLTGLHNRASLSRRLHEAFGTNPIERLPRVLLLIDLIDFKSLNDVLGQSAGDAILTATADRLSRLPGSYPLARYGGDQFAILLDDATDLDEAIHFARNLISAFDAPVRLDDAEIALYLAVGVAITQPGDGPEDLLRAAQSALNQARARGPGHVEAYAVHSQAAERDRLLLQNDLARAVERNELRLVYQPIVSLLTGQIHGLEALARWNHPERGSIPPHLFIPLAEETGLIVPIGRWVIETACREMTAWHKAYPQSEQIHLSINLSPRQFLHPHLVSDIARALRESGFDPAHLLLELTESVMIREPENVLRTLRRLEVMGVQIAIDDFGTGYSSLGALKWLPVHVLKIDRSFLKDFSQDPRDQGIIEAVLRMAQALNLQVVCEGIETTEQVEYLRNLGCQSGQGFHFAMPLEPAAVRELLRTQPAV